MERKIDGLVARLRYGKPVIVVSGLPRSGTSMAMKMLQAGGLELVVDEVREADIDNPKGYFEDERVKDLAEATDLSWLKEARGKVIKVVSSLLNYLPTGNMYKVVFMLRDLHEVLASQSKMLERRGEVHEATDDDMLELYRNHLEKVEFQLRFRRNFDALRVDYPDVIADPRTAARKIAQFLGGALDVEKMIGAVDGSLYRNRRAPDRA